MERDLHKFKPDCGHYLDLLQRGMQNVMQVTIEKMKLINTHPG